MKEIIAIVRSNMWQKTKSRLVEEGFSSFTVQRVYGRGRQKGLTYLSKSEAPAEGIRYLPKRMVTLFVHAEDVDRVVQSLISANQTREIGDGKIFICPLEGVERIRTGEKAQEALV